MDRKVLKEDRNYVLVEYLFNDEEVSEAENRVHRYLNSRLEIPGFRKGKVPKNVLKMRLGEAYKDYVLDELAESALKSEELVEKSMMMPEIVERKLEDGEARIVVEYHVEPDVELPNLENVELEIAKKDEVLKKYLESRLEDLREEYALVEPKEGEANYGDLVKVRMTVKSDGKVIRDEEYEYVLVEGDDRPFVKDLVGKKKGDEVEFDREYKGKTYHYEIEILDVFSRTLMELNDEFAKTVSGEFETMNDLKDSIIQEGEKLYEQESERVLRDQALEWLIENSELVVSDKTLEKLVDEAVEKLKEERKYESYVEEYGSEEELREKLREYYRRRILEEKAIEVFAKKNGIEVTEKDLEKEAESIAQIWGVSVERAKALVKNNERIRNEIEWTLLKNRVADEIISKATLKEVEIEDSEGMNDGKD